MAITIPIIAEYSGKALDKAIKQFKDLETNGQKAQFALKKAAVPAAAALAGLTAGAVDFAKAAIEDEAAAAALAGQLRRVTKATDAQIKASEDLISNMVRTFGVSDGDLRPALAKLATGTKSLTKAQDLLSIALDVSAATGKDLGSVADALSKAYGGNMRGLQALSPELRAAIKDGASLSDVMVILKDNFGGAAAEAADTTAGKFKIFNERMGELKESIGADLIPVIEKLTPLLDKLATWAEKNPKAFAAVALGIAGVTAAVVALNVALALNPITLIALGVTAVIAGLVLAYNKFEGFRKVVDNFITAMKGVWNDVIKPLAELSYNSFKALYEVLQKTVDLLGKLKSGIGKGGGLGIGGGLLFGSMSLDSGGGSITRASANNVNINVNGGDPNAVVDALRRYMQLNGSVPIRVSA